MKAQRGRTTLVIDVDRPRGQYMFSVGNVNSTLYTDREGMANNTVWLKIICRK